VSSAHADTLRTYAELLRSYLSIMWNSAEKNLHVWQVSFRCELCEWIRKEVERLRGVTLNAGKKAGALPDSFRNTLTTCETVVANHFRDDNANPSTAFQRAESSLKPNLNEVEDWLNLVELNSDDKPQDTISDTPKKSKKDPMPRNPKELKAVHRKILMERKNGTSKQDAIRDYVEENCSEAATELKIKRKVNALLRELNRYKDRFPT